MKPEDRRETVELPVGETMWQAIERDAKDGNELAKTFLRVRDGLKKGGKK